MKRKIRESGKSAAEKEQQRHLKAATDITIDDDGVIHTHIRMANVYGKMARLLKGKK